MKKRILAFSLCVAMIVAAMPSPVVYAVEGEGTEVESVEDPAVDSEEDIVEEEPVAEEPAEETPEEPVKTPEEPAKTPEEPAKTPVEPVTPEEPVETPAELTVPEEPEVVEEPAEEPEAESDVPAELTFYEKLLAAETLADMRVLMMNDENTEKFSSLTDDEVLDIAEHVEAVYAITGEEDLEIELMELLMTSFPVAFGLPAVLTDNVYNVNKSTWYPTLSAAILDAGNGHTIEVHNSFNETTSVEINGKQNLIIKAADGKKPTITWTSTKSVDVPGATSYHCIVIYTSVNTSTTLGGGTGTLTFDASLASDEDNKGQRARVLMHCGSGVLNLLDGIVITGGSPGGYLVNKDDPSADPDGIKDSGKYEIIGETGFGSGIYMYAGTLNMKGGTITKNYSLRGLSEGSHNYVGGGAGIYMHTNTTLNLSGGVISDNEAGSGGGGGILIGTGAALNMTGGTITGNNTNFASGGGIGVRPKYKSVKISGGTIRDNHAENAGGGFFARGDGEAIEITGGVITKNTAGASGGGILFWTVGSSSNNKLVIGGNAQITYNEALNGGGISVGREVLKGVPIGDKCTLEIKGGTISHNTAAEKGGGIFLQSDNKSKDINIVTITGGTIQGNEASTGAGIYVPGGVVTMSAGEFKENEASQDGAGIYVDGGSLTISGGSFKQNQAQRNGGGFYIAGGTCLLQGGMISGNTAEGNGGGAYVTDTSVTFGGTNGITIEKNEAAWHGGGLYIDNTGTYTTSIATGRIYENDAEGNGGGIYHTGEGSTCTVSGSSKINNNEAANGGGLYISGGSTLTVNGGAVCYNQAAGEPIGITTAYVDAYNIGVGGGIYVGAGTTVRSNFTMQAIDGKVKVGIYGNTADYAADDVYANSESTVLTLPKVADMELGDGITAVGWYEDYAEDDSKYKDGLKGNPAIPDTGTGVERYRGSQNTTAADVSVINTGDQYICLTIGVTRVGKGTLTIQKTGDKVEADEVFVFKVESTELTDTALSGFSFEVTVTGKGNVVIGQVPYGTYTVTELSHWRYQEQAVQTVVLKQNDDDQTVTFENVRTNDTWIDGTAVPEVNVSGKRKEG